MENEDTGKDAFSNLLDIILERKIQIIIGFFSVIAITIIGLFLMPPVYEATAKIYVGLPAIPRSDIPYFADLKSATSFVRNQREIIRSRLIYEKVVKKLNLHEHGDEAPSILKKIKNIFSDSVGNPDFLEEAINDLYKSTSLDLIRGTNIIEVTAYANSSKEAADIANTLAKTYIDHANNLLYSKARNAYSFIAERIELAGNELAKSRKSLKEFKGRENLISLLSIDDKLAENRNKLSEYNIQYQQVQAEIQKVGNQHYKESIIDIKGTPEEIYQIQPNDSPRIRRLKTRLKNLRNELDTTLIDYTEKHPKVVDLQSQIATIEKELSSKISLGIKDRTLDSSRKDISKNRLNYLKQKRDNVSMQIQIVKEKLRKLSKNEFKLAKLLRNVNNKENEFVMLKEKLENARILKANEMREGSIKVIDTAFPPPYPDKKKKKVLLAIGFIVSILFGLGMAFIAEYMDNSFKDHKEVEEYLELPVLATIPHITKKIQK